MKKLFSLAAAALLVGSLASVSAFAADAPKNAMTAAAPTKAAPKKVVAHHMKSCDDYAYESQAAKDCMAKGDMKMKKSPKATKASTTKKAPAAAKKTT